MEILSRHGKVLLSIVGIIVLVIALTYTSLYYWGRYEWEQAKIELLAQGEKLTLAELAPPELADDDNFWAAPIFRDPAQKAAFQAQLKAALGGDRGLNQSIGSYDYLPSLEHIAKRYRQIGQIPPESASTSNAQAILDALAPFNGALAQVRAASGRPSARFATNYNKSTFDRVDVDFYALSKVISLRAIAEAELGQGDEAAKDVLLLLRLAQLLEKEPSSFLHYGRQSLIERALTSTRAAIYYHCWSEAELSEISDTLSKISTKSSYALCLRGNRAVAIETIEPFAIRGGVIAYSQSRHLDAPGADVITTNLARLVPQGQMFDIIARYSRDTELLVHLLEHTTLAPPFPKDIEPVNSLYGTMLATLRIYPITLESTLQSEARIRETIIACSLEISPEPRGLSGHIGAVEQHSTRSHDREIIWLPKDVQRWRFRPLVDRMGRQRR